MTPATVRAALQGIVASTTGIAATSIFWAVRPQGWVEQPSALLRLRSYAGQGRDAIKYEYDPARDVGIPSTQQELEPRAKGLRSVTWQIQFTSHAATDAGDALALAMALKDRIELPEIAAALKAADLGYAGTAMLAEIDRTQDGRELSVAQLDVFLNATSDVAGTRLGFVETWGITGRATMPDGSTPIIVDGVLP